VAYLQTLLTYSVPSEAEVDRAFLESHGINVCLLNANTSRNELGAPFFVRLQVNAEDLAEAHRLIAEVNPSRFGSPERAEAIDRMVKRAALRFVLIALPPAIVAAVAVYLLFSAPAQAQPVWVRPHFFVLPNLPAEMALSTGILVAVVVGIWLNRRQR
jgi:hypothetical protein